MYLLTYLLTYLHQLISNARAYIKWTRHAHYNNCTQLYNSIYNKSSESGSWPRSAERTGTEKITSPNSLSFPISVSLPFLSSLLHPTPLLRPLPGAFPFSYLHFSLFLPAPPSLNPAFLGIVKCQPMDYWTSPNNSGTALPLIMAKTRRQKFWIKPWSQEATPSTSVDNYHDGWHAYIT